MIMLAGGPLATKYFISSGCGVRLFLLASVCPERRTELRKRLHIFVSNVHYFIQEPDVLIKDMDWTSENALEFLKGNPDFDRFINREIGHIHYSYQDIQFHIIIEETGVGFYYRYPCQNSSAFPSLCDFIDMVAPILSKYVKGREFAHLMDSPGNI